MICIAQEKLSLVKDFLVDPFLSPDSLVHADAEMLEQIVERIKKGEAQPGFDTPEGQKLGQISDQSYLRYTIPSQHLIKRTNVKLKKMINLILAHSECE